MKRAAVLFIALLSGPAGAFGASLSWTGAGDGASWSDMNNWTPNSVPGWGDDVTVVANGTVTANSSVYVNLRNLTLGDGAAATTLKVSTGIMVSQVFQLRPGSSLWVDGLETVTASTMVVETGAQITHSGPVESSTVAVRLSAGVFELQSGATVSVSGRGFRGGFPGLPGQGPGGAGTGGGGGGAGHGGNGGAGAFASNGGPSYDAAAAPAQLGSGGGGGSAGGACRGGHGGGAVLIIGTTVTLNGAVLADASAGVGNCPRSGGGGSGGAIYVQAAYFYGQAQFSARGGNGGPNGDPGGGGAGGRIALRVTGSNAGLISLSTAPGTGGTGLPSGSDGAYGTTHVNPKVWTGAGTGDCTDPGNWYASLAPANGENVIFTSTGAAKNCSWSFTNLWLGSLTLDSSYTGVLSWNTVLSSVTGNFTMAGGTLAVAPAVLLDIGGNVSQTGGTFQLSAGTLSLSGASPQTVSLLAGSYFANLRVTSAAAVTALSDLDVNGVLTIAAYGSLALSSNTVLSLSGSVLQSGTVFAPPAHLTRFDGASPQTAQMTRFGRLRVSNPAGVTIPPGLTATVSSSVVVDPGATLNAAGAILRLEGDWDNRGTFDASGGTVAFTAAAGTQTVWNGGAGFSYLSVEGLANRVFLATAVVAASGVTVSTGMLDLGSSTHSVRGYWSLQGGSVWAASAAVVFDGSGVQVVVASHTTVYFGNLISSSAVRLVLQSPVSVYGDLEMQRGILDFSSRSVTVGGNFLRAGGGVPMTARSTVTMNGSFRQILALGAGPVALHSLVAANTGPGVRLGDNLIVRGNFTVPPGAVFDGADRTVSMHGRNTVWNTAGASYVSAGGGSHQVQWDAQWPSTGTLFIAAGSTVDARVDVYRTATLQGNLFLNGSGNTLTLQSLGTLNALGSTITLSGGADIALSSGTYGHDAGSWIVFRDTGPLLGLGLAPGPVGNLRFQPTDPARTFRLQSMSVDQSLVVEAGTLLNNGNDTLTLRGDLINTGGTVTLDYLSTGTVRLTGTAVQRISSRAGDAFGAFRVASSSEVVIAGGALTVNGDLTLSSGTLKGGSAVISLKGGWRGTGGTFSAQSSTLALVNAATAQVYMDVSTQQFNGLTCSGGTKTFAAPLSAAVFSAVSSGTVLQFAAGNLFSVSDLRIHGQSPATPVLLRSTTPGTAFLLSVGVSTVTAADIRDSDARSGGTIFANDGVSVDRGNNPGWMFNPGLVLQSPGEGFLEHAGKTGVPLSQVAGTPFTVTVRAVSNEFLTVRSATFTVQVGSDDPYAAAPAAASLAAGLATFPVTMRLAEPSPRSTTLTPAAAGVPSAIAATVPVAAGAAQRLQILLPGEAPLPGSAQGIAGGSLAQLAGRAFSATVRATDVYFNVVPAVADSVALSTTSAPAASLPPPQTLTAGATVFQGIVVQSSGVFTLTSSDTLNWAILPVVSSTFAVFGVTSSSPVISFALPPYATVGTLNGRLTGGTTDAVAVNEVRAALAEARTGLYLAWSTGTFSLATPEFRRAEVTPFRGRSVVWEIPLSDNWLASGASYYIVVESSNPADRVSSFRSTFTFGTGAVPPGGESGQGNAALQPAATVPGCQVIISTLVFTTGAGGIGPGGAAALRVPDGWTRIQGTAPLPPPPGFITVISTSLAWTDMLSAELLYGPAAIGEVPLGEAWVVLRVKEGASHAFRPGEDVRITYAGLPPPGPGSVGAQAFDLRTRASGAGQLRSLASMPRLTLSPGTPRALRFTREESFSVGPLQASPTLQLQVTDACGVATAAPAALPIALSAGVLDPAGFRQDLSAQFLSVAGVPLSTVSVAAGAILSDPFFFRTSTAGIPSEFVKATATLSGIAAEAVRFVELKTSSVTLTGVSIDTGTLIPGATSAALVAGGAAGQAVIRFDLRDASVRWELLIATHPAGEPAFRASGAGDPARPVQVSWDGIRCQGPVCGFLPPGAYRVFLTAAQGVVSDASLEVRLLPTAWVRGNLGAAGAGALVRAEGSGAGKGHFAVASSTGYFQLHGLRAGGIYGITATTETMSAGTAVALSTAAGGVSASLSGTDIGTLAFPALSWIRVQAGLSQVPAGELWGAVSARNTGDSRRISGDLHYSSGSVSSDDGGGTRGRAASSWTVLAVPPDSYELEFTLPELRVSTVVHGVSAVAGGVRDLVVAFERKPNVYGSVVLPSTQAAGAWVGIQALRQGESLPTVFDGVFIPAPSAGLAPTSAPYRLYGLDPGTWTLRAQGRGFIAASTTVYLTSDRGDPLTGAGLDLVLGAGRVIQGTVTVNGDSRLLAGSVGGRAPEAAAGPSFSVFVEAVNPATAQRSGVLVHLSTDASVSQATFSIGGLEAGEWQVQAYLDGFRKLPAGPDTVRLFASSGTAADLRFFRESAQARLTVLIPRPASPCSCVADFRSVGLVTDPPGASPEAVADVTRLDGVSGASIQYFQSSMTLLTRPFGDGFYGFRFMHGRSGNVAEAFVSLANGATAEALVDLSGSTFTVSGSVFLSGSVHLRRGITEVSVSSAAGLVAHSTTSSYCLLSSSLPMTVSAAHLELVPLPREGNGIPGPLLRSTGTDCAAYRAEAPGGGAASLTGYLAAIDASGAFLFPGVPPGAYLLRNHPDLDGVPENGDETPAVSRLVRVSSDTRMDLEIPAGIRVRGRVRLGAGVAAGRDVQVTLSMGESVPPRRAVLHFNGEASLEYLFDRVPEGAGSIAAEDMGYPKVAAASPLLVQAGRSDLEPGEIVLVPAGRIQGRIAVEQVRPDGTREFVLVSAANRALLPPLAVSAAAVPWSQGGWFPAETESCGASGCETAAIGPDGKFTVSGVLPGLYDVVFHPTNDAANTQRGSLDLVPEILSGVAADGGRTVDIGVVRLRTALTLGGRVTDAASGAPVSSVRIRALPSVPVPGADSTRRPAPEARTDWDGRYELRGLDPGVRFYDIAALTREEDPGAAQSVPYEGAAAGSVDLRSTATLDFSLLPAGFSISGQAVAADGGALTSGGDREPQPGAVLLLQKQGAIPRLTPAADIVTRSEADGRFRIPHLAAGVYRLTAAAQGYAPLKRVVEVSTAPVSLGVLTLQRGGTVSGSLRAPDGTSPGQEDVKAVYAATPGLEEFLMGTLVTDPETRSVTGYRLSGFRSGTGYRISVVTGQDEIVSPEEGLFVVLQSSLEARGLDLTFRRSRPAAMGKSRRQGSDFLLEFRVPQPLRSRRADDDELTAILSTVAASGALSARSISADREGLSAVYTPAVGESSFTLRLRAYTAFRDPSSTDTVNPEFLVDSTFTFFAGLDGYHKASVPNLTGGSLVMEGGGGSLTLPQGAFYVDSSSAVQVTLQRSGELLSAAQGWAVHGLSPAEARMRSLRFAPAAYPPELLRALAASPPDVAPLSAYYDVMLPAGVRTVLAKPAELALSYSTGTDPSKLNVYWYNPAANAYILQQDAYGAQPVIDTVARTLTLRVGHFSTFVLFDAGAAAISGNAFSGGDIEAFNFPNPFDLSEKTVQTIHGSAGGPNHTIRGTLVRISVPPGMDGGGLIHIFNVAGERVRTLDLGFLAGGRYYYQPWDGRNDAGRDVASGVYIGVVKVGGKSAFFKMAVIK